MPFCAVLTEQQLHRTQGPIIPQTDNSNSAKSLVNSSGAQELRRAAAAGNVDLVRELCRKSVPFDADIVSNESVLKCVKAIKSYCDLMADPLCLFLMK
jgi:hypothetical protein